MRTEEVFLLPALVELDSVLVERLGELYEGAETAEAEEAARLAATYAAVGLRLLDAEAPIPEWAEADAAVELALIDAHQGLETCPLFHAYREDYSQFVPRGHYTRSEDLERYFRAMMWHGRMTFALRELWGGMPGVQRPDLTRAALLLVRELERVEGEDTPETEWQTIFRPTLFFVGESDDLTHLHFSQLARAVYGAELAELEPAEICDGGLIQTFMDRAEAELPEPRIRGSAPQGMRLFGQRFIPDSWYFSELVYPAVGARPDGGLRLLPSVLDVMSVLGSAEADWLQRAAGEEEYAGYREQVALLRADVTGGPPERWASTLYWGWLYTLAALLPPPEPGFPPFARDPLWARRQLMSAAGSWTELRHDTILYAKQSYTGETSAPDAAPFVQGYVEPNPWLFSRLASLAEYAHGGLVGLGIAEAEASAKLLALEDGARLLGDAAVRELERRPLTREQQQLVYHFGDWLTEVVAVGDEVGTMPDEHDRAPVVADVHTDPNTEQVLEEGTGYPARILVVADVEGRLMLCVGAVFLPHELAWPMDDRLTDEAWWDLLAEDPPEPPWWTRPVLDAGQPTPADPEPGGTGLVEASSAEVTLARVAVEPGEDLVLSASPAALRVELRPEGADPIVIELPGGSETVTVETSDLEPGRLVVVAELEDGTSFALRASIARPAVVEGDPQPPRAGGDHVRP